MLALRAIDKSFGTTRALRDVTLAVAIGEPVLLVGRNGAGKTTLLRIATGFLDADAGDVAIDGLALGGARGRAQARLGYLPEHAPAPPELTVRDHLWFRAKQKRVADVGAAIERALAAAAIADRAHVRIGTLSKGYRQRVGLADALLGDPPLLVLDEPTGGMDPIQTAELCAHLIELGKTRAILVSSHAVADLEPLAARVAVLRDGALVADGTPASLLEGSERLDDAVKRLIGAA